MKYRTFGIAVFLGMALCNGALAAAADAKDAKAQREKPLQRCDELSDKAQLDCLAKARERVLEARKKRESAAEKGNAAKATPQKSEQKAAPAK